MTDKSAEKEFVPKVYPEFGDLIHQQPEASQAHLRIAMNTLIEKATPALPTHFADEEAAGTIGSVQLQADGVRYLYTYDKTYEVDTSGLFTDFSRALGDDEKKKRTESLYALGRAKLIDVAISCLERAARHYGGAKEQGVQEDFEEMTEEQAEIEDNVSLTVTLTKDILATPLEDDNIDELGIMSEDDDEAAGPKFMLAQDIYVLHADPEGQITSSHMHTETVIACNTEYDSIGMEGWLNVDEVDTVNEIDPSTFSVVSKLEYQTVISDLAVNSIILEAGTLSRLLTVENP